MLQRAIIRVGLIFLMACLTVSVFAGGQAEEEKGVPAEMDVEVWSGNAASGVDHWRADNINEAAEELQKEMRDGGTEITFTTKPVNDSAAWGEYKRKFALAAEDGSAPEIVVTGHEDIAPWGQAGYIIP